MTSRQTNFLIAILVLIIVIGGGYLLFLNKRSNLDLVVSPYAASVTIDGTMHVHEGKLYVPPGNHTLVADFAGFASETLHFTTTTKSTTVDVVLDPVSQIGYDWLKNHPDDVAVRQKIGGNNYNQEASSLLRQFPIVADLPITGPGGEYKIGYGQVTTQNGKSTLEIDITYYTADGKDAAFQWLQSQRYDMSRFNVVYDDQTSAPPVVNNPYTN